MFLCTAGRILPGCPLVSFLRPFWWLPDFQYGFIDDHLELEEKKRVIRSKIRWRGGVVSVGQCSSRPETVRYWETVECWESSEQVHFCGVADTICAATTIVSSHALSEAYAAGSSGRLTNWSYGPVARTCCGQCPSHQRMWSTWFLTLTVMLPSRSFRLS